MIKILRTLEVDLATIRKLRARQRSTRDALRLQLAMTEAQLRRLFRTRAVLARVVKSSTEEEALTALRRLPAVVLLDASEREAWLRGALTRRQAPA